MHPAGVSEMGDQANRSRVELWAVERLIPYSRNPRKNDAAVERMASSIQEFGFKYPVLARSSGEVVDGHLRLKAARKLQLVEVPVILCDEWSAAQVKAFRLIVNRSAEWAEWDEDLLAGEFQELRDLEFDLDLTGFSPTEIDQFLRAGAAKDEDEIPDALANAVTRSGDLWVCGPHRVLCDDATSAEAVQRLLGSRQPMLLDTDPPYGIEYRPSWREEAGLGRQRQTGMVANDDRVDWSAAYRLFTGDVAYVWHAGVHAGEVAAGLESAGFRIRAQVIWAKQHFAIGRGEYHWQHEPCWYAVREGGRANWCGDRTQSTLWQVPNLNPFGGLHEEAITGHGTQKPVELMRRPILNHTRVGEIVYDPFLGSGTTLIAAERTERVCYGIEIEPRYVDLVVRRWQTLTGQTAVLEGGTTNFDEIAAARPGEDAGK